MGVYIVTRADGSRFTPRLTENGAIGCAFREARRGGFAQVDAPGGRVLLFRRRPGGVIEIRTARAIDPSDAPVVPEPLVEADPELVSVASSG